MEIKKNSLLKRISFSLLGFLLFIVFIDGSMRLVFYIYGTSRNKQAKVFRIASYNRMRLVNKPILNINHPYLPYLPSPNDYQNFSTGPKGFRGADFSAKKPQDTFRIFCLGGSTTYDSGPIEYSYPYTLEKFLNDHYKDKWNGKIEVINAGVDGYTSMEILILLAVRCLQYQPDMFTYYESINDGFASYRNKEENPEYSEEYLHYRRSGFRPPIPNTFDKLPQWLDYSALFTFVRWRILKNNPYSGSGNVALEKHFPAQYVDENFVSTAVFRRNILSIAGISASHNIPLVFVTQLYSLDAGNKSKDTGMRSLPKCDCPTMEQVMKDGVKYEQEAALRFKDYVYFVDIVKDMEPYRDELFDPVHLRAKGYKALSIAIGKKLIPIIDPILLKQDKKDGN